jgi:hypothetical protein
MARHDSLKKDYFLSVLIGDSGGFPWRVLLVFSFISLLPYLGALLDESFLLPGDAVGMFEHYGNICFTIVFPLVFLLVARGVRHFDQFMGNIDTILIESKFEKKVKLKEFLRANWVKDPYVPMKFVLILGGFIFATANAINTFRPGDVWNHDVYDSASHVWGYAAQRIFFYLWWAYVLPILVYRLFVVVITLNRLFCLVTDTDSLDLQPMHPDNAGGLGRLGRMALNFNVAMLLTMAISAALYCTHGYNTPLACGIVVQFLLLPVVFFLPLLQVHTAMRIKKESLLLEISKHYKCVSDVLVQKIAKNDREGVEKYGKVKEEYEEESKLRELYRSLEAIPTWPFDTRTIIQFTSTILLPALIWLVRGLKTLLQDT